MRPLLLAVLVLGACSIGTPGNPVLPIDAPPPIDAYVCDPAVTPGLAGPAAGDSELGIAHHPGQDCMSGCHDDGIGGDGAPTFTIAGTLYDGPSGNSPVSGATIIVVDASGAEVKLSTAANGNFYTRAVLALPVRVKATQCPKTRTMQTATTGSCNTTGCHGLGDPQGRVFLQLTP